MRIATKNTAETLKRVWPEYKCASEMREGDPTDTERYKAIYANDSTGTVYLITNPASWQREERRGITTVFRPKPQVLGKITEYSGPLEDALTGPPLRIAANSQKVSW